MILWLWLLLITKFINYIITIIITIIIIIIEMVEFQQDGVRIIDSIPSMYLIILIKFLNNYFYFYFYLFYSILFYFYILFYFI